MKLHTLMLALFIGLFLIACDNAEPNNPAPTPSEPTTTTAPAPATPPTVDDRNEVEKAADEVGDAANEVKDAAESVKGAKDALEDIPRSN